MSVSFGASLDVGGARPGSHAALFPLCEAVPAARPGGRRLAVDRESPRPGRSRRRSGERARPPPAAISTLLIRRRNVPGPSGPAKRPGAAGREHVVRPGRVVAERRRRCRPTKTQPAVVSRRGERGGVGGDQLEVLGRERLGRRDRGVDVRDRDQREGGVADARRGAPATRSIDSAEALEQRGVGGARPAGRRRRARPARRGRARPTRGDRRRSAITISSDGPGDSRRSRPGREHCSFASWT